MTCLSNRTENTRNQTTHNSATFNNNLLVQCSRVVVLGIVRRGKRWEWLWFSGLVFGWVGTRRWLGEWRWKQSDYCTAYAMKCATAAALFLSLSPLQLTVSHPLSSPAKQVSLFAPCRAAPSPVNKPINFYAPFVQASYKLDNSACVSTVLAVLANFYCVHFIYRYSMKNMLSRNFK